MFENIDGKLKGLAKFLAIAGIVLGASLLVIGFFMFVANADCLEDATIYGGSTFDLLQEKGDTAYLGIQLMIYGTIGGLVSLISSWPLYAFGELLTKISSIEQNTRKDTTKSQAQVKIDNERIDKIENLRSQGLITEEEYQQAIAKENQGE